MTDARMEADRVAHSSKPFPVVVVGTRAQLVKMAPVLLELERRSVDFRLVFTGQHLVTMEALLEQFGVQSTPAWLGKKQEIDSLGKMLPWFIRSLWTLAWTRRQLLYSPAGTRSLVVVHGDTMSTLLGAVAGRLNRLMVAHIESGLRSFKLTDPFPEELTRVLVFRLAQQAFCPGPWAASNMTRHGVRVVDTRENTLLDAVRHALARARKHTPISSRSYCVVSIHRFENIRDKDRFDWILDTVLEMSETRGVCFVMHPSTALRLHKSSRREQIRGMPNIHLSERMGYIEFIGLLSGAEFVLTDGGSNQEELYYLGIPTLVARERSERPEGLGSNAELLRRGDGVHWQTALKRIRARDIEPIVDDLRVSPSEIIVDHFVEQSG